jgi:hypothetical protein
MLLEENIGQDNHNYALISLFEYLGQPARSELGKEVAAYAHKVGAKMGTRHVNTETYVGPVMLYEREFLDHYFSFPKEQLND